MLFYDRLRIITTTRHNRQSRDHRRHHAPRDGALHSIFADVRAFVRQLHHAERDAYDNRGPFSAAFSRRHPAKCLDMEESAKAAHLFHVSVLNLL